MFQRSKNQDERYGGNKITRNTRSFHLDRKSKRKKGYKLTSFSFVLVISLLIFVVVIIVPTVFVHTNTPNNNQNDNNNLRHENVAPKNDQNRQSLKNDPTGSTAAATDKAKANANADTCLRSISELTLEERYPTKGNRHTVQPPLPLSDDPDVLVCCRTTAGNLSIMVRPSWAPIGARRFLELVRAGDYFSSRVALMRCVRNFICQFGIAGDPEISKKYAVVGKMRDDPNWLPEGPKHRTNEDGVKRFARGYLAFAGSGKDSRGNQFIVALAANERLGGGSPWEVPWGEVVGKASFDTLDSIYTGYGEKGPSQARLHREGSSDRVAKDFPKLDYITDCKVVE